jgi:hypothetical protein
MYNKLHTVKKPDTEDYSNILMWLSDSKKNNYNKDIPANYFVQCYKRNLNDDPK